MVKNVTGYDMAKLYTGSLGTLAVLGSAWLRLRPRPEVVAIFELELPAETAHQSGVAIARLHAVRACVLAGSGGAVYRCVVELAGDEESVRESAAALAQRYAARESSDDALAAVRRRQTEPSAGRMRFRIGSLPSRLADVLAALSRAGVAHLAHPGLGLVYAIFEPDQCTGAFAIARDAAAGGEVCCEAAARRVNAPEVRSCSAPSIDASSARTSSSARRSSSRVTTVGSSRSAATVSAASPARSSVRAVTRISRLLRLVSRAK